MIPAVMPTYARAPMTFDKGEGVWLTTPAGERYLDFGAGIAVTSLGHCHPHLVEALRDQAGRLWHTSNLYHIAQQERLADRLCAHSFADTVFFTNSGAEAVECAIKIARRYQSQNGAPQRYRILTFEGAFHGRTLTTIAAAGQAKLLDGFGPPVDGFDHAPFGDIEAARAAIGAQTAAIMIEPIQGEGGIRAADDGFLASLRALADEHGLLLIYDEVQTGVGRTGRLFAYEHADIAPDVMAVAKGLGGGFPLGACLASERAGRVMTPGTHGSTYGGNPLACAVGNAVLDIVLADGFLGQVRARADYLGARLEALGARYNNTVLEGGVRGAGLMRGLRCRGNVADFIAALYDQRLLAVPAGENVVRLMPPLIVEEADIDEAIARLDAACATLSSQNLSSP
jgi:acetylornithine/N-succinyldiaminopimelate aminotransferase